MKWMTALALIVGVNIGLLMWARRPGLVGPHSRPMGPELPLLLPAADFRGHGPAHPELPALGQAGLTERTPDETALRAMTRVEAVPSSYAPGLLFACGRDGDPTST